MRSEGGDSRMLAGLRAMVEVDRSRNERRCYVYTLRCNVWREECEADVMETIIVLMQVGEEAEQDKTPGGVRF
jgi:hypothetical protein